SATDWGGQSSAPAPATGWQTRTPSTPDRPRSTRTPAGSSAPCRTRARAWAARSSRSLAGRPRKRRRKASYSSSGRASSAVMACEAGDTRKPVRGVDGRESFFRSTGRKREECPSVEVTLPGQAVPSSHSLGLALKRLDHGRCVAEFAEIDDLPATERE